MTVQEMMRKREQLATRARELQQVSIAEQRSLTDAERGEYESTMEQVRRLSAAIERETELGAVETSIRGSLGTLGGETPVDGGDRRGTAGDGGDRFGAFLREVYARCASRAEDRALARNTQSITSGEGGGYLVPDDFRTELLSLSPLQSVIAPRAMVINGAGEAPEAETSFPALNQGGQGVHGGMQFHWVGEGDAPSLTSVGFHRISLKPKKLMARMLIDNALLRNASAFGATVQRIMREASAEVFDKVFLTGDGVSKPLGVLNSAACIDVARTTASTVKYQDVLAMEENLLPQSFTRAVWVAHQKLMSVIKGMKDDDNRLIFLGGDIRAQVPNVMLGREIVFSARTPAKGARGDLSLLDPSHYLIKYGSGLSISLSDQEYFSNDQTVIKMLAYVDGQPWVKEALTLEDGSTQVSPFVVLDDAA